MGEDEGQKTLRRQLTLSHMGLFDQTQVLATSQGHGVSILAGPGRQCTHIVLLDKSRNWTA